MFSYALFIGYYDQIARDQIENRDNRANTYKSVFVLYLNIKYFKTLSVRFFVLRIMHLSSAFYYRYFVTQVVLRSFSRVPN